MRVTQRLVRRRKLGVAVAVVVVSMAGIGGACDRWTWKIQAAAMAGQRELGPQQRRHHEEGGALEPLPMAKTGHGVSLGPTGTGAADPRQVRARPWARKMTTGYNAERVDQWMLIRGKVRGVALRCGRDPRVVLHHLPGSANSGCLNQHAGCGCDAG